ncbi:MAG: hypothetical protein J6L00_01475, partial [Clostridia bacterium]|nr:hypothetical protein [Clostridia bacterium]
RKWLAGCLVCLLLLCGCRAVEPITSASADVKTTTQKTDTTTTAQTIAPVTQLPLLTTKVKATTTQTRIICAPPAPQQIEFTDMQAFQKALKTANSLENLQKLFAYDGAFPKEFKENMHMLLESKFFVVPHLPDIASDVHIFFAPEGVTNVSFYLPDEFNTKTFKNMWIYHYEQETPFSNAKDNVVVETWVTDAGFAVTQYGLLNHVFEIDGYYILVKGSYSENMKRFINEISFEKVEIK